MNILILTASTGGGHKRAGAALEAKIKQINPKATVNTVDALQAIGKIYDKTVCGGYHFMATKVPKFYGECYKVTDRRNLMYKAVMRSNSMMSNKLLKVIQEYSPDLIIICHPFVTTMISRLRRHNKLDVKAISLITDYDAHRTYIVPQIDAYILAEPQMAKKLTDTYDVDKNIIYPLGIPIFDKFTLPYNKEELCKTAGLNPNILTVLLMAGSFGVTSVLDFYKTLAKSNANLQFIVITGKNKTLYEHFEKKIKSLGTQHNTKLLYFVNNVEDYMHISDIIVTKPGGLTVTESLACNLPLAIYNAFPGQERDNADFLIEQKAAIMLDKKTGAKQVVDLLNNPQQLKAMKEKCKELSVENSAEKIYNLGLKLCQKSN